MRLCVCVRACGGATTGQLEDQAQSLAETNKRVAVAAEAHEASDAKHSEQLQRVEAEVRQQCALALLRIGHRQCEPCLSYMCARRCLHEQLVAARQDAEQWQQRCRDLRHQMLRHGGGNGAGLLITGGVPVPTRDLVQVGGAGAARTQVAGP